LQKSPHKDPLESVEKEKSMIRVALILVILWGAVATLPTAQAEINKGAAQMMLEGGSSGPVPFPHQDHQTRLADCLICHNAFPQEKGSIEKLKSEGLLQKKQVMNKQCIKCHRAEKTAGNPTGPLTCNKCHVKE